MKVLRLKTEVKVFLAIVIYALAAFLINDSGQELYHVLNPVVNEDSSVLYQYTEKSNIDYKVYIKENDYVLDLYKGTNEAYITSLVDYIDVDFNYNFTGSEEADVTVTYDITANFIGEKDSSVTGDTMTIFNKPYELKETQIIKVEGLSTDVSENIIINLEDYNAQVLQFMTDLSIPVDAYLNVQLTSYVSGTTSDGDISNVYTSFINIPLGVSTFEIPNTLESSNTEVIEETTTSEEKVASSSIIMNMIIIITSIILVTVFTKKVLLNKYVTKYEKEVNKILKAYDYRIVNIENFVEMKDAHYMKIEEFNELLDLANELNYPILCFKDFQNYKTDFYIVKGNLIYQYTIELFEK